MKVTVLTLPEKGHYHPLLGPALELARRGHDVALACAFDLRAELHAAGAPRVLVPPGAPPPPAGVRGEALARVLADPVALAGWIRELLVDAPGEQIAPLRALLRAERPDVVALDTMAYAGAIAAELEGIPWVGWATSLNPVVPGATDTPLIRTLRALDPARRALFSAHGVTAELRVSDVLSPRGTAVFATEALTEPFAGPARAGVRLVGPSLGGTRGGERVDPSFAGGRPIVYVSFGSQAWFQPARFARVIAAAAELELAVIAAVGDLRLAPAPRVRCVPVADQLHALAHAHVAVTHGGANSVMEALALGVPLLVAPICNDQEHNARFVVAAGCGAVVDLDASDHGALVAALARLVAPGPERVAAAAIGASYQARGTVGAGAAELVEHACS